MSWSYYPGPKAGLASSPFARRYLGNHCYFLFLQLLRCFSSLGFLLLTSVSSDSALPLPGSPIRIPPDRCLFSTPRGFSQIIASFFGCRCQGIHRTLFLTWSLFRIDPMFLRTVILCLSCFSQLLSFLTNFSKRLLDNMLMFLYLLFGFQRTISLSENYRSLRAKQKLQRPGLFFLETCLSP